MIIIDDSTSQIHRLRSLMDEMEFTGSAYIVFRILAREA